MFARSMNSSLVHILAHWKGVKGLGTKKEELATICTLPWRCSLGISS